MVPNFRKINRKCAKSERISCYGNNIFKCCTLKNNLLKLRTIISKPAKINYYSIVIIIK